MGTSPETPGLRRAGYAAAALALALVGWLAGMRGGYGAASLAIGLGAAWAVQAASFWLLAGALERGERAMSFWTAGIAARLGGMAALWGLLRLAGEPTRQPVVAYAFALVAFLLLEAAWLTWLRPGRASIASRDAPSRRNNG